ncbi:hypothetical protein LEN26_013868 [Aphanomyces euteiches]|nr:hypothetical protein AeMF1_016975 [Aphanomyces euteiches]KAH9110055.1 hypothetical protein LEN26_013868 [Aphanomyces euteiches]KAH9193804.1 hypothetical protein AeNC1_004222 [Aphanomyces euteiches]
MNKQLRAEKSSLAVDHPSPLRKKIRTGLNDHIDGADQLIAALHSGAPRLFVTLFMKRTSDEQIALVEAVGDFLLVTAVKTCNLDACRLLIARGANPNAVDDKLKPILSLAAQKGHIGIAECLVDAGGTDGIHAALIPAAHFGFVSFLSFLLERGADANYANEKGTTALMRAAQEGQAEVATALLKFGADVNAFNSEGMTALMFASQRGHSGLVVMLLDAGALIDKQSRRGLTALSVATKRGHLQAIATLLGAGANKSIKDETGKTPLEYAIEREYSDVVHIFTTGNRYVKMAAARWNRTKQRGQLTSVPKVSVRALPVIQSQWA